MTFSHSLLLTYNHVYSRWATVKTLGAIAKDNPGVLAQIIPTLTALLNDTNPSVIRVTVNALGTVLIHI